MALLNWSTRYSFGVQRMDDQHTHLFQMLNDLHAALTKGQASNGVVGSLLQKLASYTKEHFAAEEAMLEKSGYRELAQHRTLHRNLIKPVDDFTARYQRGEVAVKLELLTFLRNWLTTHIQQEDRKYGTWLNERGAR